MESEAFFSGINAKSVRNIADIIKSSGMEFAVYRQKNGNGSCTGCVGILVSTPQEDNKTYYSLFDKFIELGAEIKGQEIGFEGIDNQFMVKYDNTHFKIGNLRNGNRLVNGDTLGHNPVNRWKLDPRVVHDYLSYQEITPYMVFFNNSF